MLLTGYITFNVSLKSFEKPPSSESFERPRYIAYAADYKPLEQMHILDIPIYGIGIAIVSLLIFFKRMVTF